MTKQIIRLTSDKKELFNFRSGAWIHTHPGLGVFFSGTDFKSFRYLTQLSPEFLAIVVDPINNAVKGFNGILMTTSEEVEPESSDEHMNAESVKATTTEKEEFTEVEVARVKPDLSNPMEMEFLQEFRRVIQSPESAREIGDTESIHAFIPMEENEFKLSTMIMKVDYLEELLSKMEARPTYSKDLALDWRRQLTVIKQKFHLDDVLVPTTFVIKPEGILYIWHETSSHLSANLIEWNSIARVDVKIRYEQDYSDYGYSTIIKVIEVAMKRKKSGFFGKRPKDVNLLVLASDSRDLYRTMVEYFPRATMYRDFLVVEPPEPEDVNESEISEEVEASDEVEEDDSDDSDVEDALTEEQTDDMNEELEFSEEENDEDNNE